MKKINKIKAGFTLMEFLAVMVVVAVLAVIAVPIYDNYVKKARFQNAVVFAQSLKVSVSSCALSLGALTGCSSGSYGIPSTAISGLAHVTAQSVSNGVISVTGGVDAADTVTADYVLSPTLITIGGNQKVLTWVASGSCLTAGYCDAGT